MEPLLKLEQQFKDMTTEERLRSHGALIGMFLGEFLRPGKAVYEIPSWICNCCGSRFITPTGGIVRYELQEGYSDYKGRNFLRPEDSWLEDRDNDGFFNCRYYYAILAGAEEARKVPLFKDMADVQYVELVADDRTYTIAYKEEEEPSED